MGVPSAVAAPSSTGQLAAAIQVERFIPVALVAAVTLVALLTVTPWPVGAFQDDAIYVVLAKALATGEGYRMINLPGAPHATHYPPGYPFFLSLLWRLFPSFPDNIVLFKFANAVWLALAALGAHVFARTRLGWAAVPAACAAAVGTLAIVVLLVTGVVLSEPMFMALLLPVLLLSERAAETGSVRTAAAAGLLCGGLALVRTLGAVTIPAALLVLLWRRRFRAAVSLASAAAICLVPWQIWLNAYQMEIPPVLMAKYGAYGPWVAQGIAEGGLSFVRGVVVANLSSVDQFLSYAFMPVSSAWIRGLAFITICALAASGLVVFLRRSPVTAWFLASYAAVILFWPFEPNRFILALWPLLTLCGLSGMLAIWRWTPHSLVGRGGRVAASVFAAAIVIGAIAYNFQGYTHQWWTSAQRDAGRRAKPIVEWVAARTEPTDVLMADDDLIVYLYAGRRGVPTSTFLPRERLTPATDEDNVAVVRTMIAAYEPRFYITTSEPGRRAGEALSQGGAPLLRRHRVLPGAFIYERVKP
jgi:hypothetical protein